MTGTADGSGQLLAVSDLHIGYSENRAPVEWRKRSEPPGRLRRILPMEV